MVSLIDNEKKVAHNLILKIHEMLGPGPNLTLRWDLPKWWEKPILPEWV